jgi:hypothetical protein
MSAPREAARKQLATLLSSALVGIGKPAAAVYAYQVGDFQLYLHQRYKINLSFLKSWGTMRGNRGRRGMG